MRRFCLMSSFFFVKEFGNGPLLTWLCAMCPPPPPLHTKVGSGRKAPTPIGSWRVRESKCKIQGWLASFPYGDLACANHPFALPHNLPSHLPRNGSPPPLPTSLYRDKSLTHNLAPALRRVLAVVALLGDGWLEYK